MDNKDKIMLDMWSEISGIYGNSQDLEEKQRILLTQFLQDKKGSALELACGNGKVLDKVSHINPHLSLSGIDYSKEMIQVAKKSKENINYMRGDIRKLRDTLGNKKYDYIFCINSLHNLPNKDFIYSVLQEISGFIQEKGFFVFDIRNSYNPFISYGYSKSRKQGLSFWTLGYFRVMREAKKNGFRVYASRGIYYQTRKESFFNSRFKILNFLYTIYLKITSIKYLSPYIFIILQKK